MNFTSTLASKPVRILLLWFIISIIGTAVYMSGVLAPAERLLLDRKFLYFQRDYERNDITLVTIDESSLERFSRQLNLHWPWPRELYGMLVAFLQEAGAKTITFDILFDRPDIDRIDTEGPVSDRRFAEAVHSYGNVILAGNSVLALPDTRDETGSSSEVQNTPVQPDEQQGKPDNDDFEIFKHHLMPVEGSHPAIPRVLPVNLPIRSLLYAGKQIGNAYIPVRHDGVIRDTYLLMPVRGTGSESHYYPSLPLAVLMHSGTGYDKNNMVLSRKNLCMPDLCIPLQNDGTYRINWYSRGGINDGTFPYYSFYDVFVSAFSFMQNRPEQAPLDTGIFRDQHIIIGASAAGLADIKTTPFSAIEPYPGMEIQATILANLLDGSFLLEISPVTVIILLWIVLLPVVAGIGYLRHFNTIALAILVPLFVIVTGFMLFALGRLILPTALFAGMSVIGISTSYVYRYLTEERQKKMIKSAFSQYIQKEFVDRIAEDPGQLKLGGQLKEMTVLFSDMANFTSISEKFTPEELSTYLNDYLSDMTEIIFSHGGTLDKFIGDAVMAFWGAPLEQPDHAFRACHCALDMQRRLEERSESWEKSGYPPVYIRIGINTGPMIVGNMGSKDRFNYTVLGDAVNLGARLEPLNKEYGTRVIISEFTLASINNMTENSAGIGLEPKVRELDHIRVKGKSKAVTVYELQDILSKKP